MRYLVLVSVLLMAACSKKEEQNDMSAIEQAGREAGKAAAEELQKPIDKAKNVEDQVLKQAEDMDKKLEEQTSESKEATPQ